MYTNYHTCKTPQFRVLSDAQIKRIYHAALECLRRTGVEVRNEEARSILKSAGADVDGSLVRIPPHIIQDAVASSPKSFTIWGRDGVHRMEIIPNRVYFGPGPTCTYFMDPMSGERRMTQKGDPAATALVCDALDNIDYVMSLGLIDDVTPSLASVYEYAEMISNTGKPVIPWAFNLNHLKDIYQIALALTGNEKEFRRRPLFGFFSTWQGPLIHTDDDMANCLWAVEHDIPVIYIGGGSVGLTAPVTGAGALAALLAGALSGLAILQLKKRGSPVCLGGVPSPMDLQTARLAYGGPEMSLYSAAGSEIFRYLGLPFMGTAGASDAKVLGLQAAIESTMQVVLSCLSGATLVHDVGFLDSADIGSLEMLIMNDEIIAMTRRVMRGIEVNDETLMLDLMDEVGPGGLFVSTSQTAKLCRQEIWNPDMMDRQSWQTWQENGSLTMLDRIKHRLDDILANHKPAPFPRGATEKISAVLNAAEDREGHGR